MKKVAVILSGCGVYDGSEIQEAVFTLWAIAKNGGTYQCFAPDIRQHHVINHLTGEEMNETRNVLTESARIARGNIKPLGEYNADDFDALVIPGGFGVAKNLSQWAFEGPNGKINSEVKEAVIATVNAKKGIAALCMGPTAVAKSLEGTDIHASLTVGTDKEASPYDIKAISEGMNITGAHAVMKTVREIEVDSDHKIISAPCYMMETDIVGVQQNVQQAIDALFKII